MRRAAFCVNFIAALLLTAAGAFCLVHAAMNPAAPAAAAASVAGLLLIIPFGAWALSEYRAHVHRHIDAVRQAALFSSMFGAFLLFAATVAAFSPSPPGMPAPAWLGLIPVALLAVWFLAIGRFRRQELLELLEAEPPEEPDTPSATTANQEPERPETP